MKLSLSTNWCNRRLERGEEIVDAALALGFDELELGFHTTREQADGFRARLGEMPVGSVHAFCPVPISAPHGHPELYSLASFDAEARAMARLQVGRNIEFASSMGADTVVLHAGRVLFTTFFNRNFTSGDLSEALAAAKGDLENAKYKKLLAKAKGLRAKRGAALMDIFKAELAALIPLLEKNGVVLALENLPYLEGFPDESEMEKLEAEFKGAPIEAWFDTGHHRVREMHGWLAGEIKAKVRGMHLNDVVDYSDDHLPPGEGKVDFKSLEGLAISVKHVVIEPNASVRTEALAKGVEHIRTLWPAFAK